MMDGLTPYPRMKDSGNRWFELVPDHWTVERLSSVVEMRVSNVDKHSQEGEDPVRLCNYVDVYKNDRIRASMPFARGTATRQEIERFRLRAGDVLITKDSEAWDDIGVPALVEESADDLVSGYHLAILRPRMDRILGEYLYWALRSAAVSPQFYVRAAGVTRYGLSHGAIKATSIPVPPLLEQEAMVRLLDHANERIERYIRAKEKLIELLEEQKQAIIHRAITRGLDPNVPLKRSPTPWLGDIPEHWEVRRLKTLVQTIDQGVSPQAENFLAEDEAWGVLKAGAVNHGVFRAREHKRLPDGFAFDPSLVVAEGDVIVSRASGSPGLVGSAGIVDEVGYNLILSDKTFRPVFRAGVEPQFMAMCMNSRYYRQQVKLTVSGAEGLANNLPLSSLRSFVFAVPPIREQREIVEHLVRETGSVARALALTERQRSQVREFLMRLTADVVTGRVDVREVGGAELEEALS